MQSIQSFSRAKAVAPSASRSRRTRDAHSIPVVLGGRRDLFPAFDRRRCARGRGRCCIEVIEADCLQGWDTYCSSDCARRRWATTYETIDPSALLGG